ncbi:MAG: FtsW/RodA/SpoVE family cell cycle protein, partial [Lentisphaerae bacterium]|nr:FtsW/RodA/SpoVE family cell cycle protein [Lentisphaerota bacterium]
VVAALVTLSLIYIRSTDIVGPNFEIGTKWLWQAVWAALGTALLLSARSIDYRLLGPALFALYAVCVGLLLYVYFCGPVINGARRWLLLCGVISVQPAGPARFVTLLTFCYWISPKCPFELPKLLHRAIAYAILFTPAFLIAIEPAGGNALTLVLAGFVIELVHRAPTSVVRRILIYAGLGFALAQVELSWVRGRHIDPEIVREAYDWWFYGHQTNRVTWFLSEAGCWNGKQSVLSIMSGGLTGKGLGQGFLQALGYLPRGVSSSDFIFAVVGEESGFVGCAVVLCLYGTLITLGYAIAARARDPFGRLAATGITTIFALHTLVNLLMVVRMCPIIGLPLPFLSKGGTFLAMSMLGMGVLASVHRQSVKAELANAGEREAAPSPPEGVHQAVLTCGPFLRVFVEFTQSGLDECAEVLEARAAAHAAGLLFPLGPPDDPPPSGQRKTRRRRRRPPTSRQAAPQREFPNFPVPVGEAD